MTHLPKKRQISLGTSLLEWKDVLQNSKKVHSKQKCYNFLFPFHISLFYNQALLFVTKLSTERLSTFSIASEGIEDIQDAFMERHGKKKSLQKK